LVSGGLDYVRFGPKADINASLIVNWNDSRSLGASFLDQKVGDMVQRIELSIELADVLWIKCL
jgi:hypothetical protein